MLGHALQVIVEPPSSAVLDLADGFVVLEAAQDRVDGGVVVGVQAVEDGAGQAVPLFQIAKEGRGLGGGGGVVHAVKAGIRA